MNILIPMAGEGSRFKKEGYTFPKPLITVNGKPMIQTVVENLWFDDATYIFLVRKEHLEKYNGLKQMLSNITKGNYEIVVVPGLTEGAACTAHLAKNLIDSTEPLLIANSDQIIKYRQENFISLINYTDIDGIVFAFNSTHPKWSFVKINQQGFITEVAEKTPISNIATCGIYWYRRGKDFISCTERMVRRNIRVNNEFYIAPVYNEFISENNAKLIPFYVDEMWGLGTPEDLNHYLNRKE